MTTKFKIIGAVVIIFVIILFALLSKGCNDTKVDEHQRVIDSLTYEVENLKKEIVKQDELILYYANEYDSTAKINDSLSEIGVKTIIKYKEVRVQADTTEIFAVCDSLANEYGAFILQTKETLMAADSVMSAQGVQLGNFKEQIKTYDKLTEKLKGKIKEQEEQIQKLNKLAKRRGRTLEW